MDFQGGGPDIKNRGNIYDKDPMHAPPPCVPYIPQSFLMWYWFTRHEIVMLLSWPWWVLVTDAAMSHDIHVGGDSDHLEYSDLDVECRHGYEFDSDTVDDVNRVGFLILSWNWKNLIAPLLWGTGALPAEPGRLPNDRCRSQNAWHFWKWNCDI